MLAPMRAILLVAAVLAVLAGLLAFLNAGGPKLPAGEDPTRHVAPPVADPAPTGPDEASADPEPLGEPEEPAATIDDRTDEAAGPLPGPTRPFRGIVMSQPEGERPVQARFGRLDLEVLSGGTRTPLTLDLPGGRFDARIPDRARLVLLGGEFEGTRVRFDAPKGPFDPSPEEYALVAIPIPEIQLDVVEGSQDVPLTGVRVARADDPTGSWLGDEAPAFDFLMEDADSPLTLPDLDAQQSPVWVLHGDTVVLHAPAQVFVDGEVEEPGSVAFRDGLSVSQAVALAGGPTDFAGTRAVVLRDGKKIPVNLRRIRRGAISDPILRPDDTLILRRSWL